jgi:hypothetical protein
MAEQKQNTKCRCLRSKSSYSSLGEYREDLEAIMGTTSTFWCLKTMSKAGPDEHYVHASKCHEGRRCWEAAEE